jgi:hypothetical protein
MRQHDGENALDELSNRRPEFLSYSAAHTFDLAANRNQYIRAAFSQT